MSTLLKIDVSSRGDRSISRKLSSLFLEHWRLAHANGKIIERDIATTDLPFVEFPWIIANVTKLSARTEEQKSLLQLSDDLIAELQQADEYLIATPIIFHVAVRKLSDALAHYAGHRHSHPFRAQPIHGRKVSSTIRIDRQVPPARIVFPAIHLPARVHLRYLASTQVENVADRRATRGLLHPLSIGIVDVAGTLRPAHRDNAVLAIVGEGVALAVVPNIARRVVNDAAPRDPIVAAGKRVLRSRSGARRQILLPAVAVAVIYVREPESGRILRTVGTASAADEAIEVVVDVTPRSIYAVGRVKQAAVPTVSQQLVIVWVHDVVAVNRSAWIAACRRAAGEGRSRGLQRERRPSIPADATSAIVQYQRIVREELQEEEPMYYGGNARRRIQQMQRRHRGRRY